MKPNLLSQGHKSILLDRSASVDNLGRRSTDESGGKNDISMSTTSGSSANIVSIGVQVDLCKSVSSPSLRRRLADKADLYTDVENVAGNVVTSRHNKEPR